MKPGFYVGNSTNRLFVVGDGAANSICVGSKGEIYSLTLDSYSMIRPATRQDIIDKLLPLIPEKKEPGQVAFEEWMKNPIFGKRLMWGEEDPQYKANWAAVERAVLEAHK